MASLPPPTTTIPPFNDPAKLPPCAAACIPLYDANGGCVPPVVAVEAGKEAFTSCFCMNTHVKAFQTGSKGVCDKACTAESGGLASIYNWYQKICTDVIENNNPTGGNNNGGNNAGDANDADASTSADGSSTTGGSKSSANVNSGDWISNHWQWVIMIVILAVAIVGIWIGACIWRRRYLRKKDRQSSLAQKHSGTANRPSWGPGMSASGSGSVAPTPYDPPATHMGVIGSGEPAYEDKPKRKWMVRERT